MKSGQIAATQQAKFIMAWRKGEPVGGVPPGLRSMPSQGSGLSPCPRAAQDFR